MQASGDAYNRPMRRAALIALLLLAGAGTALAAKGDPRKAITRADQARARAMLVKKADLAAGFRVRASSGQEPDFYCKAVDESDLTVTGDADSPDFDLESQGVTVLSVSSHASLYRTVGQANTSWRRSTSAAGERCARSLLAKILGPLGVRGVALAHAAFPAVAPRTIRYRVSGTLAAQGRRVPLTFDIVVLQNGRAQVSLFFFRLGTAPSVAEEVALARLTAERMSKALGSAPSA